MKKQLTHITPLRNGIVLAVLYGFLALILMPFLIVAILVSGKAAVAEIVLVVLLPVFYALAGLIGGILFAALYNLIAQWTGGIEFSVSDSAPPAA